MAYKPNNKRINDAGILHEKFQKYTEPFSFIVGADPQFGLISRYIEKQKIVVWDKELELFKKCVNKINNLQPKPLFFAIMGDLCDALPTGEEDYAMRQKQEEDFFSVVGQLDSDISFVTVPGNHDVGDIPTPLSVERYHHSFGRDYYSFIVGGVHFIVISSQYYVDSTNVTSLAKEHDKWIDQELEKAKGSSVGPVIFMHTPPFVSDVNEEDTYFSLVKVQREQLLKRFSAAGIILQGVKYVFCGHLHKNGGGKYENLEVIVTTAIGGQLGNDKSGFRIVTVNNGKLEQKFCTIED